MTDQKKLVTERKEEKKTTDLGGSTSLSAERDAALDAWMNRPKFSYNVNEDALYQQYADTYKRGGRMAMLDTMGQAQTMTGGYGNSYAQSAGQQAYQGYMQQLNDVIPELYSLAYGMYNDEGERLAEKYQVLAGLEEQEYQRGIDKRDYDYLLSRDAIEDDQWQKTYDLNEKQVNDNISMNSWQKEQDTYNKKINEAQIAASLGDFSGYEDLGYDLSNLGAVLSVGDPYSVSQEEEDKFFAYLGDGKEENAYKYLLLLKAKGTDLAVIDQYMQFLSPEFLDKIEKQVDTTVDPLGYGSGSGTGIFGRFVREIK